jgi:hypothetical protein
MEPAAVSKQPPSDHEYDPFKPTLEEERYLAFKARAVRGALGLRSALSDAAEALTLIDNARFAVGIYPDDELPDYYGLLVLKGEAIADEVIHATVPTVPWTAIPLASRRVAELVRRMQRHALRPAEQLARAAVDAAFAETRKVMAEHGLTPESATLEFLMHGIHRLWNAEDREGLRAKVHAQVDLYVDGLFDFIGDGVARAA